MPELYVNGEKVEPVEKVKLGEKLKKSVNELVRDAPKQQKPK